MTGAPPPPALVAAEVRQAGEDVVARLSFGAPVPAVGAGQRVCVTLAAGRICLHGQGARIARRRHGMWVVAGNAPVTRSANDVTVRAGVARLGLRFGRAIRWTADAADQMLTGTLHTHRFRLLATGDSMIQVTDSLLADRLRGRQVISEAHVSTGLSKAGIFGLNWMRHAAAQARSLHPDATVVWIGPNEGFPIDRAPCCGPAWVRGYVGRAASMMRSYRRGGRAVVYWLTLPIPRSDALAHVMRAVNRAIVRAARRVGAGAHVIDMRKVFTPHGHFQQRACYRGSCFDARQPDGVHLSITGSRVAADIITRRLRADGVIRG